jgi:hypothetical protein
MEGNVNLRCAITGGMRDDRVIFFEPSTGEPGLGKITDHASLLVPHLCRVVQSNGSPSRVPITGLAADCSGSKTG